MNVISLDILCGYGYADIVGCIGFAEITSPIKPLTY